MDTSTSVKLPGPPVPDGNGESAPRQDSEPNRQRSRLVRNISMLAGGQIATWGLTAIYTIVVTRAIGPWGAGQLATAVAASSVVGALIPLGTYMHVTKVTARARDRGSELLGAAFTLQAATFVPAIIILLAYTWVAHYGRLQTALILLLAIALMPELITLTALSALRGLEQMQHVAVASLIQAGLTAFGGVAVVLAGFGVIGLAVVAILQQIAAALYCTHVLRRYVHYAWRARFVKAVDLAKMGMPYLLSNVVFTSYLWIDTLILSVMVPAAVVGWYAAATRLFGTLLVVPVILSTAWLPRLSAAFTGDHSLFRREASQAMEIVLLGALPIAAGGAILGPRIVELAFGPEFAKAGVVLSILALTLVPSYANTMVFQILAAQDRVGSWTAVLTASAVLNLASNVIIVPFCAQHFDNGALGAAICLFITEAAMSVGAMRLMVGTVDPSSLARLGRALMATALMGGVVFLLRDRNVLVAVFAGGVTCLSAAHLLGVFRPEELGYVSSRVGQMGRRLAAVGRWTR